MNPILFLDFDGVLNSLEFFGRTNNFTTIRNQNDMLDPVAVKRLNRIIKATDALVVISSSWRLNYKLTELIKLLVSVGFMGKVIGTTIDDPRVNRGVEIAHWLSSNHYRGPYIIL